MSARQFDTHTLRVLWAACCQVVRPRFRGGIADWVKAQKVRITATQNKTYAGEIYDFDRFPVASTLVFGFFADRQARELIVQKPVQTALTACAFFAVAWTLVEGGGGNVIYVMHGRDDARNKVKSDIKPIFGQIQGLTNPDDKVDPETGSMELRYGRGTFMVGGGQSASTLTSTAAGTVLLDEAALHRIIAGKTTHDLARERLTGADEGKLMSFSKPEREAVFTPDEKTGRMKYEPHELTVMDAEFLSGDQREFHCPCPHCGTWQSIQWEAIRYSHLNEALPGAAPIWAWDRFESEVYWECPTCQGQVHEGREKREMILAGAAAAREPGGMARCWPPAPANQRRAAGMYPRAQPAKWSATISSLTDIAFSSLTWGKLAIQWINAQGDPTKLVAFITGRLGKPEPHMRSGDTTLDHLRKLIPAPESRDPIPWRMRHDDGTLTCRIPILSTAMDYVGMCSDLQKDRLKYGVRAFGKDGRSYLLDYGALTDENEVPGYLDQMVFHTLDDVPFRIFKTYIDVGHRFNEVLDLCWEQHPRIEGIKGDGTQFGKGTMWVGKRLNSDKPMCYHFMDAQYWERHLYYHRIQNYDPRRHSTIAPAMYFPVDISDDYLRELTAMKEVREIPPGGRGMPKIYFKKVHSAMENDFGDIEKYFCGMDYNLGIRHPHNGGPGPVPGLQPLDPGGEGEAAEPPEAGRAVREYVLK